MKKYSTNLYLETNKLLYLIIYDHSYEVYQACFHKNVLYVKGNWICVYTTGRLGHVAKHGTIPVLSRTYNIDLVSIYEEQYVNWKSYDNMS